VIQIFIDQTLVTTFRSIGAFLAVVMAGGIATFVVAVRAIVAVSAAVAALSAVMAVRAILSMTSAVSTFAAMMAVYGILPPRARRRAREAQSRQCRGRQTQFE